ncbi:MAG: hypothetical protein O7E52_09190 [Candidatus Poribacteria bacterium]|nr:hypothetical protein [Candidatus Poribacteria bacterium]
MVRPEVIRKRLNRLGDGVMGKWAKPLHPTPIPQHPLSRGQASNAQSPRDVGLRSLPPQNSYVELTLL